MFFRQTHNYSHDRKTLSGYRPCWVWSTLVLIAVNILSLAIPLLTLQIYDRILVYANLGTLNILCLGATGAIIVETMLRICRSYDIGLGSAVYEHTANCALLQHILSIGSNSGGNRSGEYIQIASGIGKIRDVHAGRMLATLVDVPFIFIFLGIITYLAGKLVLVPVIFLILMWLSASFFGKRLSRNLQKRATADSARYNTLIQCLGNTHVVKSLGHEGFFERLYERRQQESTDAHFAVSGSNADMFDLSIFFSRLIFIAVIIFGAPMVLERHISMGVLVACVILSGRITHPVQRTLSFLASFQEAVLAEKNLKKIFSVPTHYEKKEEAFECKGEIDIKNVLCTNHLGFKVLNDINLSIKSGEAIAIHGEQTDSKEAFVNLLAGLRTPQSGEILVDGVDPSLLFSEELVKHVGYISPNSVLFKGSIYDNISKFGHENEESVQEMSDLLGIDEEIARMPGGYATFLDGEKTDVLSPGLKKRIAIARVLISKPKIILSNNAERDLDKAAYADVHKLLFRLKGLATLVIVSNDRNILDIAEKHFSLVDGRLVNSDYKDSHSLNRAKPYKEIM